MIKGIRLAKEQRVKRGRCVWRRELNVDVYVYVCECCHSPIDFISLYTRLHCSCLQYLLHYLLIRSRRCQDSLYLLPKMSQPFWNIHWTVSIERHQLSSLIQRLYSSRSTHISWLLSSIFGTQILQVECRFRAQNLSSQSLLGLQYLLGCDLF